MKQRLPFIYGAQYYRAPTPAPEYWEPDFKLARQAGLTDLKFWAQWRVNNPAEGEFQFSDLDRLMELASQYDLRVTLNIVYDVMPQWLLYKYPDCLMIRSNGAPVMLGPDGSRPIGGAPGPCLNHAGAKAARLRFTEALLQRYRGHSALGMWDVWNEPEQCFPYRAPLVENLTCYCPACARKFRAWLQEKYQTISNLNSVWGRYYRQWAEIELPVKLGACADMLDWRLFMLDTVTHEAQWRIAAAKRIDPLHPVYTHVVPFIAGDGWGLNQVTCADDFALGEQGDVFAGSINGFPVQPVKIVSAARGRVSYNVESHLNAGSASLHPLPLTAARLRMEFLAHLGLGIRGFLFWQLHAETLGLEAPAWGLLDTGGQPRQGLDVAREFKAKLEPYLDAIMTAPPPVPQAGIFVSAANEILHWQMGLLSEYRQNLEGYSNLLYRLNIPYSYVPATSLNQRNLADLKLLILPSAYCLHPHEAEALLAWIKAGGCLVAEAHTAGYNQSSGRHEGVLPGLGLAHVMGIREVESQGRLDPAAGSSAVEKNISENFSSEVLVALGAYVRMGRVPLSLEGQAAMGWGIRRCAGLKASSSASILARFSDRLPALLETRLGRGRVLYAGTTLGGALEDANPITALLAAWLIKLAAPTAGLHSVGTAPVHLDALKCADGRILFVVIGSASGTLSASWQSPWPLRGIFSGITLPCQADQVHLELPGPFADLFVPAVG